MSFSPFLSIEDVFGAFPVDDTQTLASQLIREEPGDFYKLFPKDPYAWTSNKQNLRQFCFQFEHLEVRFKNSTGHIGFGPWFDCDQVMLMTKGLPTRHVDSLFETIESIMLDYTPWGWLEQFMNGEYVRSATPETKAQIDSALRGHETALMNLGARRAKEQLAWRFGILW